MAAKLNFKINIDTKMLKSKSKKAINDALEVSALSMLEWSANGSSKEPAKAPIRWGVLRASGSAFVGSKLINTTIDTPTKDGTPTPARSYSGRNRVITIIYNTDYAAKQHEVKLNPGKFSQQDGNANPGNQWLLRHMVKDAPLWENVMKQRMGKYF